MADKIIYAMYDDDELLKDGARKLVEKGVKVKTTYSPFPIHGIDPIIGIQETRLGICAFMYGLTGLALGLLGMWYFNIKDWPMNIGGKPSFSFMENLPAFIPIAFEFTVLLAAHGMAITYFIRNKTLPGMPARNPDPRTTDDRFVIEFHTKDNHKYSGEELTSMIKETAIVELNEKGI